MTSTPNTTSHLDPGRGPCHDARTRISTVTTCMGHERSSGRSKGGRGTAMSVGRSCTTAHARHLPHLRCGACTSLPVWVCCPRREIFSRCPRQLGVSKTSAITRRMAGAIGTCSTATTNYVILLTEPATIASAQCSCRGARAKNFSQELQPART